MKPIADLDAFIETLTPEQQKRIAETQVGEILNEIMQADPNILKQFALAEELQKGSGMDFLTQQIMQNPEITAIFENVISTSAHPTATRFVRTLESQRKHLVKLQKKLVPVIEESDNLQKALGDFVDTELTRIQQRINDTIVNVMEEAKFLHPNMSPTELAEASFVALNSEYKFADDAVDLLYSQLDNEQLVSISQIRRSIIEAKFPPRHALANIERIKSGRPIVGMKGSSQEFGNLSTDLLASIELNFGGKISKVDFGTLRDYRAILNNEITLAQRAKDPETVARLMVLKGGLDKQLKAIGRRAGGKTARLYEKANKMNKEVFDKFQKGFAKVSIIEDIGNMGKMSPESFWNTWIRADSRGKAIEAADQFKKIFADKNGVIPKNIEALIIDYVAYNLNKRISLDKLDFKGIERWLGSHKTSLEQLGVWDKFDDVGRARARAEGTIENLNIERAVLEKSELSQLVKSKDIGKYIRQNLGGRNLTKLKQEIVKTGNKSAVRAFNREVWLALAEGNKTGRLDTVEGFIRDPDALLFTMLEQKEELIGALGKNHYKSLKIIADVTKRTEGNVDTLGKLAHELSKAPRGSGKALQSAFSKIRASLQGFVSPTYTVVQLLNQGVDLITSGAAIKVIEEAMYNPQYALELAEIAKTKAGRDAVRSIWLTVTLSTANLDKDDSRTED